MTRLLLLSAYALFAAMLLLPCACRPVHAELVANYDASNRTLTVTTSSERHFKYVFNKGGAINGVYDLDVAPNTNLVGESFQGETTDRVIQWTYWNSRYRAQAHESGDGDVRANATMEGCFHGKFTCEDLESPKTGRAKSLAFRSRIRHWFYSVLDRHGRPDFETTSRYEVLDDGSLKLTRSILRRPWPLRDVQERTWDGKQWNVSELKDTTLVAKHYRHGPTTSYLEAWTPLRRTALPKQMHGRGTFDKDGYRFWPADELGGWAMAYGDKQAFATVFGVSSKDEAGGIPVVFNKLNLPQHRLNILLPAIQSDWPDNSTLTQTFIFVVGEPDDVKLRASKWVAEVPSPHLRADHEN